MGRKRLEIVERGGRGGNGRTCRCRDGREVEGMDGNGKVG